MRKIENIGNLPGHLQLFAKKFSGMYGATDTEFYEFNSVDEFEKAARGDLEEGTKFEITPAVDMKNDRTFLVGFDVSEPKRIVTLDFYASLKIFFIELSPEEFKKWAERITRDRQLQQQEMFDRRERIKRSRELREKLGVRK